MADKINSAIIKQLLKNRNGAELAASLSTTQDAELLVEIVKALGKLQDPSTITAISQCLQHEEFFVKQSAVQTLGKINDIQVVPELLQVTQRPNPILQKMAISGLVNIEDKRVRPCLLELVANQSEIVRKAAANALKKLGEDQWQEAVQGDTDDFLRLAQLGAQPPVEVLLKQLSDEAFVVREQAAKTLMVMAENQPLRLKSDWSKICKLIRAEHKSNHDDEQVNKSSDCDYHADTHADTGIGLKFPTELPKDF
jgi:HEAT repeat protein